MKEYFWEIRKEGDKWFQYQDGKLFQELDEQTVYYCIIRRLKDDVDCSFSYSYEGWEGEE
jgi:hypothetical protein